MRSSSRHAQRGFALLAVLWIVMGIGVFALAGALLARHAIAATRNRTNWIVARWQAEGCIARMRALITPALVGTPDETQRAWQSLGQLVDSNATTRATGCHVTLNAAGTRLDVNAASSDEIRSVFVAAGVQNYRADTLAAALMDWRDADDDPRPLGAERAWYLAHDSPLPRNGPLASVTELQRVRGLAEVPGLDTLFDVEPGRIPLASASLPTLAALPGFSAEAVDRVGQLRQQGIYVRSVLDLDPLLSTPARTQLHESYAELSRLITSVPDAWVVVSISSVGDPAVSAHIELRLERATDHAAIARERIW